jgi:hypothetical protein
MNRVVVARKLLARLVQLFKDARKGTAEEAAEVLDSAIAHLDLELEERENRTLSALVIEDPSRPEWREGWPRGTWVSSFGFVFEARFTARDAEGSLMYLVPASQFGLEAAPTRWVTVYAGGVNEARLADGRIFSRTV